MASVLCSTVLVHMCNLCTVREYAVACTNSVHCFHFALVNRKTLSHFLRGGELRISGVNVQHTGGSTTRSWQKLQQRSSEEALSWNYCCHRYRTIHSAISS